MVRCTRGILAFFSRLQSLFSAGPPNPARIVTRDWWDTRRRLHKLAASQVVLDEAGKGDPGLARWRLEGLRELRLWGINAAVAVLAEAFLAN